MRHYVANKITSHLSGISPAMAILNYREVPEMKRFGILLIVAMLGLVLVCGCGEEKKAPAKPAAPAPQAEKAAPPAPPATPAPAAEQPKAEHPKAEPAKPEHPKAEHPK
jgi:hypothetical protein